MVLAYVLTGLVMVIAMGVFLGRGAYMRAHPPPEGHPRRGRTLALTVGGLLLAEDIILITLSKKRSIGEFVVLLAMTAFVSGYLYWRFGGFSRFRE